MITTLEAFRKQAEDWLEPLGYSLHFFSADGRDLHFSNVDEEHSPGIRCTYNKGFPYVRLTTVNFKMFFSMTTNNLQFKHPDIAKYIAVAKHYQYVCDKYPPF